MVDSESADASILLHLHSNTDNTDKRGKDKKKKKKKKRGGGSKKKTGSAEQSIAFRSVSEWVFLEEEQRRQRQNSDFDGFGVDTTGFGRSAENVVFELHSHSKCSDGFLSPTKLVERAHSKGVSLLILKNMKFRNNFFWNWLCV